LLVGANAEEALAFLDPREIKAATFEADL